MYLGGETETETEDLLDTERSFDYQDQAYRQTSICDAASLAPTLDGSISELLFASPIQPIDALASGSRQHRDNLNDDDDWTLNSCEPPTPTNKSLQQKSQFFPPAKNEPENTNKNDKELKDNNNNNKQSASEKTQVNLENEFNKQDQLSEMIYAQKQQLNAKRHAKSTNNNNKSPTNSSASPSPMMNADAQLQSAMFSANDAAELDRLLAEMSQSLDLDSLARFDRVHHKSIGSKEQQTSKQALETADSERARLKLNINRDQYNHSIYHGNKAATLASANPSANSHDNNRSQLDSAATAAPSEQKFNTNRNMPLQPAAQQSNESILDEYDDASRILEQMISDAQMASNPNKQQRTQLAQRPINSTSVSPIKRNYEPKLIDCTLVKQSVLPKINNDSVIVKSHAIKPQWTATSNSMDARKGETLSDRLQASSSDSRRAWRENQKPSLQSQQSTRQNYENERNLAHLNMQKGGEIPPELPEKDYPQATNDNNECQQWQNVIEARAIDDDSDDSNENHDSNDAKLFGMQKAGKAQLAWMKRRTMSSMRSMRSKLSDFMAHSGDAWAHHNRNANGVNGSSRETRVKQVAAKFESNQENNNSNYLKKIKDDTNLNDEYEKEFTSRKPSERESRSRSRNANARKLYQQMEPLSEQLSNLGQQIKKRLSRSKSRLGEIFTASKMHLTNANRAKSMPNDKMITTVTRKNESPISLATIEDATNEEMVKSASPKRAASSSAGSSSSLSGLEKTTTTLTNSQQRPLTRIASSSSMKRLSGIRMMPTNKQTSTFDAIDKPYDKPTPPKPHKRSRTHKRKRNKNFKGDDILTRQDDSNNSTSDLKANNVQRNDDAIASNNHSEDYFLQKLASSSDSDGSKSDIDSDSDLKTTIQDHHHRTKSSQSLNKLQNLKNKLAKTPPSDKQIKDDHNDQDEFMKKKKSQSLRCLGQDNNQSGLHSQLNRRLPESGNTFRPASVARMLTSPTSNQVQLQNQKQSERRSRSTVTRSALSNYATPRAGSSRRSSSSQSLDRTKSSSRELAPKPPPRLRQRAKSMHATDRNKSNTNMDADLNNPTNATSGQMKPSKSRLSILASQLKQMAPFKTSAGKINSSLASSKEPISKLPRPINRKSRREQEDNLKIERLNQETNTNNDNNSLCHWSPVIKTNANNSNIPSWFQKGKMLSEL